MKNKNILTLLIIIIVALLGYAIYSKFNPTTKTVEGQLSEKEINSLVVKVSKLINVPEETPVIATIIKADQLIAEQKFYSGSIDGDYLMVFPKAQKAMIYRESENKLINVGPIVVDKVATSTKQLEQVPTATTTSKATSTKDEQ